MSLGIKNSAAAACGVPHSHSIFAKSNIAAHGPFIDCFALSFTLVAVISLLDKCCIFLIFGIFFRKRIGEKATSNRERMLRDLADAQHAPLKIISGFVGLAEWVATEAIESCID